MKIVKLAAENVKKLKVVEITPNGALVEITGPNGSGKSSVLDAIFYALGSAKGLPSEPIRRGAKSARIQLDLGEIIVTRKIGESGTQLVVESAAGARFPSPQRMLSDAIGAISFDPLGFIRAEPPDQFEMLRKVAKIEVDIDAINGQNQRDYDARTDVNRKAKELRAQAAGIEVPDDLPADAVDVDALITKLEEAGTHNATLEQRKARREQAQRDAAQDRRIANDKREEAARLRRQADEIEAVASKFDESAAAAEKKLADAEALPDPIDTAALRLDVDKARKLNDLIAARARRARVEAEATTEEAKATALTEAMEKRDKEKEAAIGAAKMPIEDLTLGDGQVLYRGLPLDQASSAEQLRVSVAIAMAANPKLKVLLIKEGSLLDENGLQLLRDMAETHDYQVWLERVDTSGKVGIVMEDGHVAGPPYSTKATDTPAASGETAPETQQPQLQV